MDLLVVSLKLPLLEVATRETEESVFDWETKGNIAICVGLPTKTNLHFGIWYRGPGGRHMLGLSMNVPQFLRASTGFLVCGDVPKTQLSKANRPDLTFWFSHFGFPFLVEVPKGDHLLVLGPLGN